MRFAMVIVLAGLAALPLSVSAQDAEESATVEPSAEEPVPSSEPAPAEPALQLKLDETGVEVAPSPPRTPDGDTLEDMQRRVRNARIGVGISLLSVLVGGVLLAVALDEGIFPDDPNAYTARDNRIGIAAATLTTGGVVSLLATGILLGVRKRKLQSHKQELRELQRDLPLGARGARPASASTMVAPRTANAFEVQPQARRVQWDLAQSRLVF